MNAETNGDVQNRILALVTSILTQNGIAVALNAGTRLADAGLASMDMVNLMLAVEAEFDLTIPQAEITPENFQSVQTIERMIVKQQHQAKAA
jgi:acyl carrier protein